MSFYLSFKNYIQRHPAAFYFIITFLISWLGAFILVAPKLLSGEPVQKMDGILMFPVMLIGPTVTGVILTAMIDGKPGLRNLFSHMGNWKVSFKWYAIALLIPPCLINVVLMLLSKIVSPVFTPNFFPVGFLFGIPAGFFEEIGWTGFAFPKMRLKQNIIKAAILLGFLWGAWHLPVIDFLGVATPHGKFLLPFFISFIAVLTAMRVIITWVYTHTQSVLLAQLMHAVSTGCLVMFGPSKVSAAQEALWYGSYAVLLWTVVLLFLFRKQTI